MRLKLADVRPNPFRDFSVNPLRTEKIEGLVASINETGFWDNVVVRKSNAGEYEQAYGHNRVAAALKAGLTEADFIVRDLSDEMMIKIMDRENREEFGSKDLLTVMESVEAVVKALAKGSVKPFKHSETVKKSTLCFAPSFISGNSGSDSLPHPYTVLNIATFLGRVYAAKMQKEKEVAADEVKAAFYILRNVEMGIPGWRREVQGKWPVSRVLEAAHNQEIQAEKRLTAAKQQAKQTQDDGKKAQQQLDQMLADQRKADQDAEKARQARLEAKKNQLAAEAKVQADKLAALEAERKERDKKIREAEDKKNKIDKQIKKDAAEIKRLADEAEQRKATQFVQRVKTFIDNLNRVFGDEDKLYAEGIRLKEDSRLTTAQRSGIALALRDASSRMANFNPHKTEPSAFDEEGMKMLKSKARKAKGGKKK